MKNSILNFKPQKISQIIGQKHLLNENGLITRMIKNKQLFSIIFFGPPGTGKTTLSSLIAKELDIPCMVFNASIDNKSKLDEIVSISKMHENFILIIEEIHRLHKDKQDIFLSLIENSNITIFSTTTENPYFVINPAIRSRCQLIELLDINEEELFIGLKALIKNNKLKTNINDKCLKIIAKNANGDIRVALNSIDLIIRLYPNEEINEEILKNIISKPVIFGSHYGDEYHNLKSAFHKSLRGSDVDASLHYLARLIKMEALDDIARRMLCVAYEDVGLANPNLSLRVSQGIESCYRLGFPEAINVLGSLCIQLACSPKSNSASKAINLALKDLDNKNNIVIPKHLWDSHYQNAHKLGVTGYLYPHDYKNNYVKQQYLPKSLLGAKYFTPNDNNEYEKKIMEWIDKVSKL